MILGDGYLGALFLALGSFLKNHFESDPEKQQATCDAESTDADAEHSQYLYASYGKQRHDNETDDGCAQRDLTAMAAVHARCEC